MTKMGTALHEASLCGKIEVVKLLIEVGIETGSITQRGAFRLVGVLY